ncbi:MAG: arylsulfatase [Pigmentiphaga sp.]|nr:arylsulfatase [Pigmentiphaga sp.]
MKPKLFYLSTSVLALHAIGLTGQTNPNIIIILADDLGYGDLSVYGSNTISTPNIDKIANEGVRFTQGYATSATSTPSRYAMLTGMYPWKNKNAKILPGDAPLLIRTDEYTLPKMMQESGYVTAAIGKWHLGMGEGNVDWNKTIKPGATEVGFDYSNLIAATNDRTPTVYVENGNVVGLNLNDPLLVSYQENFPGEPTAVTHPELLNMHWSHGHNQSIHNGIPRIGYQKGGKSALWKDEEMADYFTSVAKSFLTENKDKPFFMYFGLHQPHVPRAPSSRFVGVSGMGPRGDVIVEADWSVGEIINHLEKLKILENTLVIFSSDNGPVLDDGYKDHAVELLGEHKPSGPLRGGKYSLFEAGTRVPLIVYWKNNIKPTVSDALVCHLDFMASISALIQYPINKDVDSQNILSALLGKSKKGRKDLIIEANGKLAYRSGKWVLLPPYQGKKHNLSGNELGNLPEGGLYNLKTDLGQQYNLITVKRKRYDKMYKRFTSITERFINQ